MTEYNCYDQENFAQSIEREREREIVKVNLNSDQVYERKEKNNKSLRDFVIYISVVKIVIVEALSARNENY